MIDPFVTWQWCSEHRSSIALADVQWNLSTSGHEAYASGHIPGASFIDMETALAGPGRPEEGRHPLPSPERFAAALGAAGIDGTRTVVAYDADGGVYAARLVWLLRQLAVEAALLDGGLCAYPGKLETGWPAIQPATFAARPWPPGAFASTADILDAPRSGAIVIDARPRPRFLGADTLDPRPGHMPGAHCIPARENLTDGHKVASPQRLRETFAAAGITPGSDVISSCGSGVTACHNLLTLEWAGLGPGRLYPPSWSGWAAREDLPVELH